MIFDDEYGKLSTSFGLVRAPCALAAQSYAEWQAGILRPLGCQVEVKQVEGGLRSCFDALFPLVMPVPTKHIFIPTTGPWSLFVENYRIGTDAVGSMTMASKFLETDAMRVVIAEQRVGKRTQRISQYGATILEYYSHGETRRSIACANDGGRWVFESSGDPFEFEDHEAYQSRSIRDRFTKELLLEYLISLGVGYLNDELCAPSPTSPAYLVERVGRPVQNCTEMTREQFLAQQ